MSDKARDIGTWIVIAVLSVGLVVLYTDNSRTKECLAAYIRQDAEATAPRIEASAERNAAMDKLVADIATSKSQAQTNAALTQYNESAAAAEKKRTANPPPPFPERCV